MKQVKVVMSAMVMFMLAIVLAPAALAHDDLADGNGDMHIYAGGSTGDAEDLVFAIQDDDAYEIDGTDLGDLVWSIEDNDLVGPEGCTSEPGVIDGTTYLRRADGKVLFTLYGRRVWYGAVDGNSGGETLRGQHAYNIWGNHFYPGPRWQTDPVTPSPFHPLPSVRHF